MKVPLVIQGNFCYFYTIKKYIMNETIRNEINKQRHYEILMSRYYRLKNRPYERLKEAIFEAIHFEQICNFFGRTTQK